MIKFNSLRLKMCSGQYVGDAPYRTGQLMLWEICCSLRLQVLKQGSHRILALKFNVFSWLSMTYLNNFHDIFDQEQDSTYYKVHRNSLLKLSRVCLIAKASRNKFHDFPGPHKQCTDFPWLSRPGKCYYSNCTTFQFHELCKPMKYEDRQLHWNTWLCKRKFLRQAFEN